MFSFNKPLCAILLFTTTTTPTELFSGAGASTARRTPEEVAEAQTPLQLYKTAQAGLKSIIKNLKLVKRQHKKAKKELSRFFGKTRNPWHASSRLIQTRLTEGQEIYWDVSFDGIPEDAVEEYKRRANAVRDLELDLKEIQAGQNAVLAMVQSAKDMIAANRELEAEYEALRQSIAEEHVSDASSTGSIDSNESGFEDE